MKKSRQPEKKNRQHAKAVGRAKPRSLSEDDLTSVSGGSIKGDVAIGMKAIGQGLGMIAGAGQAIVDGVTTGGLGGITWNGGKGPRG